AGVTAGVSSKAPVRAATTANITLSAEQTIDGVAVVADDRVLVKDQTDGIENGIYDAKSGAWVRSRDFDGTRDVKSGPFVVVASGSAGAGTIWRITTADDITIGTTSIAFAQMTVSGASAFILTLLDDATAAAARTTLGAGTGSLDNVVEDTTPQLGGPLDTNGQLIQFSEGAAIASASSCDIWGGDDGNTVHITGTTNIDDFATAPKAGAYMWVIFDGAASVVDSATITVDGNATFQAAANVLGLVYAERQTSNGPRTTADMTSWYVLKDYRGQGVGKKMMALATLDPDVTVTNFSSAKAAVNVLEKAGLRELDRERLVWHPSKDAGFGVHEDPLPLGDRLPAKDRRIIEDHQGLRLRFLSVETPEGLCTMVIYPQKKHDDYVTHEIMYLADQPLFARFAKQIAASVLPSEAAILSLDRRFARDGIVCDEVREFATPRYCQHGLLDPSEIDMLYSECVLLNIKIH
ncbi:hypothetical protein LCGC14_1470390, partial [marine sediment metagenome]